MPVELYSVYSQPAALEALGIAGASSSRWGGRLVIGPDALALFTAVGPAESAPSFLTPERFRFRPDRPYSRSVPGSDWMPEALAHPADGPPDVHLFLQEGEERYRYVGRLRLGMYTLPRDYRHQYADFDVTPRLAREQWLRYGGYPGWKLTLNHQDTFLDPGDLAALEARLASLRGQEDAHLCLTRYEGDGLTLLANPSHAYLAYQNEWGGEEVVRNPAYPEDTEEVADFYCSCGAGLELPLCSVVSREQGLEAVREFFTSGARPTQVAWSEE
jgi:hypothetical protein